MLPPMLYEKAFFDFLRKNETSIVYIVNFNTKSVNGSVFNILHLSFTLLENC